MRKKMRNTQRGFTLVELMIAIAIVAVLLGAVTLGVGAINSGRLSAAEQDIMTLYKGATAWSAQQSPQGYSNISLATMQSAGVLSSSFSGNNPWGNAYRVSGSASSVTIQTDVASASNCGALSGRFTERAAGVSCNTATLTITF